MNIFTHKKLRRFCFLPPLFIGSLSLRVGWVNIHRRQKEKTTKQMNFSKRETYVDGGRVTLYCRVVWLTCCSYIYSMVWVFGLPPKRSHRKQKRLRSLQQHHHAVYRRTEEIIICCRKMLRMKCGPKRHCTRHYCLQGDFL